MEVAIGSNTCVSWNSAINIPLTIHFIVPSLRSCSPFSFQGPFMGLIFPSHQATLIKKHTQGFSRWTLHLMANSAVSQSVKTKAIIHLIGHSSTSQGQTFHDSAGIYNPTGPNTPSHSKQWSVQVCVCICVFFAVSIQLF